MPLDWPPNYPNDLIPQTTVIIGEELKEHPVQTETLQLCTSVISKLTPYFCAAVKSKTLRPDLVLYVMGGLLDCLLVYNCDDPSEMYRLKKKAMNSDEWLKLAGEIARVSSVGRPQDQPGETTGHKDAKHATEPPEEESEKHRPKDFEGLDKSQKARNYSDMLASADLTDKQHKCASLMFEYGLSFKEVASRVRIHRRTVHDHIEAAGKKIGMARFKESGAKQKAKTKPGSLEPDSLD